MQDGTISGRALTFGVWGGGGNSSARSPTNPGGGGSVSPVADIPGTLYYADSIGSFVAYNFQTQEIKGMWIDKSVSWGVVSRDRKWKGLVTDPKDVIYVENVDDPSQSHDIDLGK